MIQIKIKELTKGFVIEYFDDKQPSEMDEENYCENWDATVKYLEKKVKATFDSRLDS